jgi:CheY-like chemotaxis protein
MSSLRILILDDSEITLNLMSMVLSEAGYEVYTASSLMEFEQVLSNHEPNLILTDIKMPEISGDKICKVLKQKLSTQSTPVVLFSTLPEKDLAELAERSGADGYVSKGAGPEEIVKRIQELTSEILF